MKFLCPCVKKVYLNQHKQIVVKSVIVMSCVACYCYFLCILVVNASLLSVLASNTSCPTLHYYNNVTGQCEYEPMLVCSNGKIESENGKCVTSSEKKGDYSGTSEERTLWGWAFSPLYGGCPLSEILVFVHAQRGLL